MAIGETSKTWERQKNMKTTPRSFYEEMTKAEELLARAAELRKNIEQAYVDTEQERESVALNSKEIVSLSAEANARIALAHLYYITG